MSGFPEYSYRIDGGEYGEQNMFDNLTAGNYNVGVIDLKGCEAEEVVTLEQGDPIAIDAGPDIEIDLGFQDTLSTTLDPPGLDVTYSWGPTDGLDCIGSDTTDCADPIVIAPGNTTYTVTITDVNGCTATDQLTVRTNIVRPVYEPNVITPNTRDQNSIFVLGFGRQAMQVNEFRIYDRWGSEIYKDVNISLDENYTMTRGWDGRFGNGIGSSSSAQVNPGMFVWYADVEFIDGVVISMAGDVTVIK